MFGTFFFLSLFFQEVQGYTPLQAGLRSLPSTAMIILVAPFAGRIAGRIGSRVPMVVGLLHQRRCLVPVHAGGGDQQLHVTSGRCLR